MTKPFLAISLFTSIFAINLRSTMGDCTTEEAACRANTACLTCLNSADTNEECGAASTTTCAAHAADCCGTYGDACSDNSLLLEYVNCAVEQVTNDCGIYSLCDYEDDDGSGGDNDDDDGDDDDDDDDECEDELIACEEDSNCIACLNSADTNEECGAASTTTCAAHAADCCGTYGDACSDNSLLLEYVNCAVEQVTNDCGIYSLCDYEDDDGSGGDNDDDECEDELIACEEDFDCIACLDSAEDLDDGECTTGGTTCQTQADMFCCMFANSTASCSRNTLLLGFTSCMTELVANDCETTDLCSSSGTMGSFTHSGVANVGAAATAVATLLASTMGTLV